MELLRVLPDRPHKESSRTYLHRLVPRDGFTNLFTGHVRPSQRGQYADCRCYPNPLSRIYVKVNSSSCRRSYTLTPRPHRISPACAEQYQWTWCSHHPLSSASGSRVRSIFGSIISTRLPLYLRNFISARGSVCRKPGLSAQKQ